jgi:hypothetical protein
MFRLDDIHLEKAKEIAGKNRIKKNCNVCYERGYIGVTEQNLLFLCHKCVDLDKAMQEWKNYLEDFPDLKEHFKELFEEEEQNDDEGER